MNYNSILNGIETLEKKAGMLRLLLFLYGKDEYMLSDIWNDSGIQRNSGYGSILLLKELGLVKSRIDSSSYPSKNMFSLTYKGIKVAEHLKEIEEILKE